MQLHAAVMKADTVYHGGKIYTITEDFHKPSALETPNTAEVVATLNGQIVFAGSEAEARSQGLFDKGTAARIVDLKGKTMLPGFVDGHSHFPNQGRIDLFQVNLNSPPIGKMNSIEDYVTAFAEVAARTEKGKVINGVGYDDTLVKERTHPTKDDLDRASRDHPIVALHTSEHLRAVNSLALANSGLYDKDINEKGVYVNPKDGKEYPGVHTRKAADGSWELTGVFAESAAMGLLGAGEAPTVDNSGAKAVARTSQVYAAAGVTTADQGAGVFAMPTVINGQFQYAGYNLSEVQNGLAQGVMGVRLILHPFGYMNIGNGLDLGAISRMALGWTGTGFTEKGASSPSVGDDITSLSLTGVAIGGKAPEGLPADRIFLGTWKFVYDGSNQGYTGYFKKPGYWNPSFGGYAPGYDGLPSEVTYTREKLEEQVDFYHAKSEPFEIHTNGSQAAEDFITAIEKAVAAHPDVKDMRHTSIHAQMMERQHIERLVGDYSKLDATKDMYESLSGAAVDTDLRARLGNGQLMRDQNLINSYFINHAYFWGDRHLEIFMGPGRGKNMNPAGWSVAMDNLYTFHNDTTVTPISPLRSLQSAVERVSAPTSLGAGGTLVSGEGKDLDAIVYYPEVKGGTEKPFWNYDQRISVLQALHGLTIVPAYQNRLEDRVGSIKEGKFADFVILDRDPFAVKPSELASIRVASTIVGDTVVHGVLPDDESFASQLAPAYIQPGGVTPTDFKSQSLDPATAEKTYASLPEGTKRLGTFDFSATIPAGKSAVFQMNFLGNGEAVNTMSLLKLTETKVTSYEYGMPTPAELETASGKWWIADIDAPTKALKADDTLMMDHTYTAFFVIADNDPVFDHDGTDGVIADPVALATTGPLPDNGTNVGSSDDGGSSSGCTVGSTPSYDLLLLFLGLSVTVFLRTVRRKTAK